MSSKLRIVSLLFGLLALALVMVPRVAWAIEYEVFVDVDSEEELYDLWITEQISEDTYNTLIELRRSGVDLNQADREQLYSLPNLSYEDVDAIVAYRAEVGTIHAPADLVAAGVLSRDKLGSILTYVRAHDERSKLAATSGSIRYLTAWSQKDSTVPPMALQVRVNTLRQLTIGALGMLTRQRIGNPVWDPNRDALVAGPMQPRVILPKAFVQWDTNKWGVILGTYRIGFAQRLVFDNTPRYTPNGFVVDDAVLPNQRLGAGCRESQGELPESPCAGEAGDTYVTRDFRYRDGLRGLAIGAKHLEVGNGWVQLYGFSSFQPRKIYQYQIYDRRACDDPRSTDEACSAPETLVSSTTDPLDPTPSHKFQTLPNMVDELLGGGNFTWFHDRRTHVGVTGYGANAIWKVKGADLDFQEWAPQPFGGAWGAVGADMAWGRRWSDLTFEVARSFDSMKTVTKDDDYGGGGWAALLRHTSTIGKDHELEISGRYYDTKYANPYAGPIAQADQYDGNRSRDEVGGRIRYGGRIAKRADVRAMTDIWFQPSEGSPKLMTYVRTDVDVNPWFRPGLWLQYRNSDLRPKVAGACLADSSSPDDDSGNITNTDGSIAYTYGCIRQVGQITGRLGFRPGKGKISITVQYQHKLAQETLKPEAPKEPDPEEPVPEEPMPVVPDELKFRLRQDISTFVIVRANPFKTLRISGRLKYLNVDVFDKNFKDDKGVTQGNKRYEQSVWAYFDVSYVFARLFLVRTRYDVFAWLDQRDNTLDRIPRIEHRLRLELELKF